MLQKMNLKINLNYIYIVIFASFFFFWSITLGDFYNYFLSDQISIQISSTLSRIKLSYLILILLIPIFYRLVRKRNSFFKGIFNNQKHIIIFILFIIVHYFLVKIYYQEIFTKYEIESLIYLLLLSIIYSHYRSFILVHFKKIIIFYLIILISYSIFEGSQIYNFGFWKDNVLYFKNEGQCNVDLFLIGILRKYLSISLSNSIYAENSHLAMMSVAVLFASIYILVQEKKSNILFLLLFLIEIIIVLTNLSTTYFVCYLVSQITLLFFFLKRISIKFWIFTILLLFINSYLFFSDKNCTVKVTDFKISDVLDKKLVKVDINLTTLIYKRSVILALDTIKDHSLGWGIDGMDDATYNLMSKYKNNPLCWPLAEVTMVYRESVCKDKDDVNKEWAAWQLGVLNLKDGLSNFFKMFTEFGIFTFIIFFYFIKYILNIKNINPYNLFIITLFVTMCIRGVGYFSGGFIFCLFEFFYCKKFSNQFMLKNKHND